MLARSRSIWPVTITLAIGATLAAGCGSESASSATPSPDAAAYCTPLVSLISALEGDLSDPTVLQAVQDATGDVVREADDVAAVDVVIEVGGVGGVASLTRQVLTAENDDERTHAAERLDLMLGDYELFDPAAAVEEVATDCPGQSYDVPVELIELAQTLRE